MVLDVSSERRSCTSWVMNCNPSRCLRARFAMLTMKAAPSGCCMMLHTSSTTRSLGLGSWAAAAHTVSVQTIAAAGRSSGSKQPEVEDGDQGLVAQQVVALVGEQVSQAAGGEGPEQPCEAGVSRLALLQILVEVPEAGALPWLGVVARQGVIEGGPALRSEALAHHHLDQPSQAADALEKLLGVSLVDHEGVHALARHAGGQHPVLPLRGPCPRTPPRGR